MPRTSAKDQLREPPAYARERHDTDDDAGATADRHELNAVACRLLERFERPLPAEQQ
jgi:hypothetical protein